ncbi:helix-hairpin-helix domain-containing protein [Sulfurimonas sp. SAG-AH-194-L11]|nr:helix-hairpin-helix domain-containing protein [Sulfurimonas sp. SAG-AH-194-L11]MDF1877470.1 helix-hairpin-helix domain-containing protein [Sulfurimonas sp. SAG-AH-194-L11]
MKVLLGLLLLVSLVFSAVDLNTASFEELVELKGIGKKKAKKILKYRKKHCFKSVKELKKVKGIGKKKAKKIIKKNKKNIVTSECRSEE